MQMPPGNPVAQSQVLPLIEPQESLPVSAKVAQSAMQGVFKEIQPEESKVIYESAPK